LDPSIASRIDTLVAEAEAILAELSRVKSSRKPSKAGVGLFAKFVVPPGYKRLARQVGSLWLNSSYQAQLKRLEGIGDAWRQRVLAFLGTVRAMPSSGQRTVDSRRLQAGFSKTQGYGRLDTRLRHGMAFLADLARREVVSAGEPVVPRAFVQARPHPVPSSAHVRYQIATFPPSVIKKLPDPVRKSIEQALESYRREMYEPAAVMLRKAVQNAIVLRFEAEGAADQVLLPSGDALPFPRLIEKAREARLISSQQAKELMRVKWLGDTAAHSYVNEITKGDLDGILLIVRLALERIFTIRIRPTTEQAHKES